MTKATRTQPSFKQCLKGRGWLSSNLNNLVSIKMRQVLGFTRTLLWILILESEPSMESSRVVVSIHPLFSVADWGFLWFLMVNQYLLLVSPDAKVLLSSQIVMMRLMLMDRSCRLIWNLYNQLTMSVNLYTISIKNNLQRDV